MSYSENAPRESSEPEAELEIELLNYLEEERRDNARNHISAYCRYIEIPGAPLNPEDQECEEFYTDSIEPAEHHEILLDALMRVARGEIKILMVFMPPGSAKSTYASVTFPTWYMGAFPNSNIIMTTYGSDLARKFGRKCRQIAKSRRFNELFNCTLTGDNAAADDWSLTNGSTYMSGGILSGITGNRADGLIIDDPIKGREEADSEPVRKKIFDTYQDDLDTRLKPSAWQIIIQTRWHAEDLSGCLLPEDYDGRSGWVKSRTGAKMYVICLQAQCERADDPLKRKIGEYLWTKWFPVAWWEQKKKDKAGRSWNALYQQRPSSAEGDIYKRSSWRVWKPEAPPPIDYVFQTYDTAFEEKEENDPSACITWGVFHIKDANKNPVPQLIMINAWDKRLTYPDLREKVVMDYDEYEPDKIIIEKKASGHSLIQDLRRDNLPILAYKPGDRSKTFRASIASIVLEAKSVWVPAKKMVSETGEVTYVIRPFAQRVIEQCASFPRGKHDDLVDCVTMGFLFTRRHFWLGLPVDDETDYISEQKERRIYG